MALNGRWHYSIAGKRAQMSVFECKVSIRLGHMRRENQIRVRDRPLGYPFCQLRFDMANPSIQYYLRVRLKAADVLSPAPNSLLRLIPIIWTRPPPSMPAADRTYE